MGVGGARRALQFVLARLRVAEAQIVLDRAVEQIGILIDDRDVAMNIPRLEFPQITSADAYAALLRVVKAHQETHDARFSRAARANDTDTLPCRQMETQILVRLAPPTRIGEAHMIEADGGREIFRRLPGVVARRNRWRRFQHRKYPRRRRQADHALMQQRAHVPLGSIHFDTHHEDDEQHFQTHLSRADSVGTVSEGYGSTDGETHIDDAAGKRIGGENPHCCAEQRMGLAGQKLGPGGTLAECLEGGKPLDGVEKLRGKRRIGFLAA